MTTVEERMRLALELRELMIAMRRQVLAREHPADSPEAIEARLREWLMSTGLPRRDPKQPAQP